MRGPLATPENLAAICRHGEELGFSYVYVSDHIVIPRDIDSRYPYNESGEWGGGGTGEWLEQLTVLSYLAGQTSSLRLLTSVMVLPYRSPVYVANVLSTIDVLSGGRLTLGCGVGWMSEEFKALGAPPFEERGTVGSEYIRALKELWTSDAPEFAGKYCSFSNITFAPKPTQKPHPPIWVGGESDPALKRAALLGDGWYPIGNNARFPLRSPGQISRAVERLHQYAEAGNRDPAAIDLAFSASWYDERTKQTAPEGGRLSFTGNPEQIAEDITAFAEVGIRHLMLNLQTPTLQETQERMRYFANEVTPLVKA